MTIKTYDTYIGINGYDYNALVKASSPQQARILLFQEIPAVVQDTRVVNEQTLIKEAEEMGEKPANYYKLQEYKKLHRRKAPVIIYNEGT